MLPRWTRRSTRASTRARPGCWRASLRAPRTETSACARRRTRSFETRRRGTTSPPSRGALWRTRSRWTAPRTTPGACARWSGSTRWWWRGGASWRTSPRTSPRRETRASGAKTSPQAGASVRFRQVLTIRIVNQPQTPTRWRRRRITRGCIPAWLRPGLCQERWTCPWLSASRRKRHRASTPCSRAQACG